LSEGCREDAVLRELVANWHRLTPSVRHAILALVRTSQRADRPHGGLAMGDATLDSHDRTGYQAAKFKRANPASISLRLNDFDGLNDESVRDGGMGLSLLGCGWHNPLPGLRIKA
jgi:hypothetical protein